MTEALTPHRFPWTVLFGAGIALLTASLGIARIPNLVEAPRQFLALFALASAGYAAGIWAVARLSDRRAMTVMLLVALACRSALLPSLPTLSTDLYRYVWDARVARAGIDPYAAVPADPELSRLRDAVIYPRLNHPTWRTIYPPGAQALFRAVDAVAPENVIAMKAAIGLAELATLGGLASLLRALGLPLAQLVIYAWNPLVLTEIWGSGHLDGVVVLAVVLAARAAVAGRGTVAAALLGLGALVKLYPAALLPLLLDRNPVRRLAVFGTIVVAGYIPWFHLGLDALGSLPQYVRSEYFNPGLVRSLVDITPLAVAAVAAWVLLVAVRRRGRSLVDLAVPLIGGFVLLAPNIFPWYVLWLVPFLAVTPSPPWIAFTGTVVLAYTFFLHEPWAIPGWARALEFLPLAAGAAWLGTRRWIVRRQAVGAGSM